MAGIERPLPFIRRGSVARRILKGKTHSGQFDFVKRRNILIVREKVDRIIKDGRVHLMAYPHLEHFQNFRRGSEFVDPSLFPEQRRTRKYHISTGPSRASPEAIGTIKLTVPKEGVPQEYGYPKEGRPTLFLEYAQAHIVLKNNPHVTPALFKKYANWRYYALEEAIRLARKMGRNLLIPQDNLETLVNTEVDHDRFADGIEEDALTRYMPSEFKPNRFAKELEDACKKNGVRLTKIKWGKVIETG